MAQNDDNKKKLIGPGKAMDEIADIIKEALGFDRTSAQPQSAQTRTAPRRPQQNNLNVSKMGPEELSDRSLGNYLKGSIEKYQKLLRNKKTCEVISHLIKSMNKQYRVIKAKDLPNLYVEFLKLTTRYPLLGDGDITYFPRNVNEGRKVKDAYEQFFNYLGKVNKKTGRKKGKEKTEEIEKITVSLPPDFYTKERFDANGNTKKAYETWLKDNPWSFEAFIKNLCDKGYVIKGERDKYYIERGSEKYTLEEAVVNYIKENGLEGTDQFIKRFKIVNVPYVPLIRFSNPLSTKGRRTRTRKYTLKKEKREDK